jgi:hypothetical protein
MGMTPEPLEALCRLSETYGPALCREPQRMEAMLRDLCPEHKREVFLLVSALKEQIVPDLMSVQVGAVGGVPEEVIVSRSRRQSWLHRRIVRLGRRFVAASLPNSRGDSRHTPPRLRTNSV